MCIETCLTQIHNLNPYLTSLFIVFFSFPRFSSIKPIHTFIFAKYQRTFSLVLFLHNLITMKPVVLRKLSNSRESSLRKLAHIQKSRIHKRLVPKNKLVLSTVLFLHKKREDSIPSFPLNL